MSTSIGIEAINFYGGPSFIDVETIFKERGLNLDRFSNLMMKKKSVGLPCEDAVTNGVNAAKPIIDRLTPEEKSKIELVITSSESSIDFGKSMSTYIHDYLGLSRNCRLFEVKQACYGGTAALHMASCFVASMASPGSKALIIATDIARAAAKMTYAEPSQAVGAIAMLVSAKPNILELDFGATGYYSYEVMDTCRPLPEIETGDPDLSLLSYLECSENSFNEYKKRVKDANYQETFDYLAFHTPFAGMVKGAHRKVMFANTNASAQQVEHDFEARVVPSLSYCQQVGNVYSATVYLALCGLIDTAKIDDIKRVGIFSYGSGCSSEFYSGLVTPKSKEMLSEMKIQENLDRRYKLTMEKYDRLLDLNSEWYFGIKNKKVDVSQFKEIYNHFFAGKDLLVLDEVEENWHRKYRWCR